MGRTYRLRLYSNSADILLIQVLDDALCLLFPTDKVAHVQHKRHNFLYLSVYANRIPDMFPKTNGEKHLGGWELAEWQLVLIRQRPKPFLAGLFNSDGCRLNIAKPRYEFSNCSRYIVDLLCHSLDALNVPYFRRFRTMSLERRTPSEVVVVARSEAVALLDTFIPRKR